MGFDQNGESIMICPEKDRSMVMGLFAEFKQGLRSGIDQFTLNRAVLEIIASTGVESIEELLVFIKSTLIF